MSSLWAWVCADILPQALRSLISFCLPSCYSQLTEWSLNWWCGTPAHERYCTSQLAAVLVIQSAAHMLSMEESMHSHLLISYMVSYYFLLYYFLIFKRTKTNYFRKKGGDSAFYNCKWCLWSFHLYFLSKFGLLIYLANSFLSKWVISVLLFTCQPTTFILQNLLLSIYKPMSENLKKDKIVIMMLYLVYSTFCNNVDAASSLQKIQIHQNTVYTKQYYLKVYCQSSPNHSIILFQKIKTTKPKIFKIEIKYKETRILTSSNNIVPINRDHCTTKY